MTLPLRPNDRGDAEFAALLRYAAAIGRDPALVQGAGGNVSLKRDGVLWVKASGTWLAEARQRDIMVPVRLQAMLRDLADPDPTSAEDVSRHVVAEQNTEGLRPSIETTMHGALPHRIVVHVHCVETLAWAARADAPAQMAPRLVGLRWVFVPYVRPGAPLTRAILQRMAPDTDVIVLGNHGLVVGGADTETAASLLAEVCRRLRRTRRVAPPPDLSTLAAVAAATGFVPPTDTATHGIATDPDSLRVATQGSLYPDHVIFLGPGVVVWPDMPPTRTPAPLLVVPGAGVLLAPGASAGALALAGCLADVAGRLRGEEPLITLSPPQEAELLGWDAEKYRQGLDPR